ncbi:MAG: hypothetical protein D6717_06470 [Gammaproteobacteria bacterium]|nr:MAG: hypothetical protein D6717_06470 [Gammaproteobacteria bacterium]
MGGKIVEVHRYASYYRGWCQAFGEFEPGGEGPCCSWLFGEDAIGMVVAESLHRPFMRELLHHGEEPEVRLEPERLHCGSLDLAIEPGPDRRGFERLQALLRSGLSVHMYLTSHIFFPGARIVTFSPRRPLIIMYKEIQPMRICLPSGEEG